MDQNSLTLERYDAGARYLVALRKLGLEPDSLFWAHDKVREEFCLVLVTKFFDFKGPLAVSELLFKAYLAAGTPQEIDPFIVRLHSPEHALVRALAPLIRSTGTIPSDQDKDRYHREIIAGHEKQIGVLHAEYGGMEFFGAWIYWVNENSKRSWELAQPWKTFVKRVERLAA